MDKAEKLKNYRKELKKIADRKLKEVIFNYSDIGGEGGVSSLSLEFPSLCFLISLKRELVTVHVKA